MTVRTLAAELVRDRRARRRVLLATLGGWLVFALAAGGGLVQYSPDGWIVPLQTWITYAYPTPYGFYALDAHWAVVPVPLYLVQALGMALLAGTYAGIASVGRRCRVEAPRRRRIFGLTGTVAGVLGAAACCSPLAIVLGMLLGSSLAAAFTDIGLWAAAGLFAAAILVEAGRLRAVDDTSQSADGRQVVASGGQRTSPSRSSATVPSAAHSGQEREVVRSSRS